ncbi:MAG TPA: LuxR C-terminal-related transcriptional regulator [Sporichthya sp.]|nr:LuxR C-terminal-related transcriptional regulator [Sporichthya sp.]
MNPNDVQRRSDRLDRLIAVLARLDAPSRPVPDLLLAVPDLVCELGFDRAFISRVEDNQTHPQLAEMIRDLHPILVTGLPSYVAAPIVSGGQAVGILQADCRASGRRLDEMDRDILAAFAVGLRMAMSGSVLHEQLLGTRNRVAALSRDLGATPGEIGEIPVARAGDLAARSGAQEWLPDTLTDREFEVLGLIAVGCTNTAIAERLQIAEGTAKKHVIRILRKLGVSNRSEAVAFWFRAGHGVSSVR